MLSYDDEDSDYEAEALDDEDSDDEPEKDDEPEEAVKNESHDPSRLIKQPLRTYESYFAIRHKVAFRFDNNGSIGRTKGPFNNAFAFNDHTIRHAAET